MIQMTTKMIIAIIAYATAASSLMTESETHLRGNTNKATDDVNMNGDYMMNHLRGNNGRGLMQHKNRRVLNGGIPSAKNIVVPCYNATSNCGINGQCRVDGSVSLCKCDDGYYSMDRLKPCEAKGKPQALMAAMWYLFGWTGGPAFALGWISLGAWILTTFCCGCCCLAEAKSSSRSEDKKGAMACFGVLNYIALVALLIYGGIMVSSSNCIDSDGVPCKKW